MSYVEKNLLPGETVVLTGRLHWVIYAKSIVIVGLGILSIIPSLLPGTHDPYLAKLWYFGAVAILLGLLAAVPAALAAASTELVVTSRRIVAKRGLIRRETFEMLHRKVESISVHQSIAGRILGYGTLVIHGTGGGSEVIPTIAAPLAFRNAAMAQSEI